MKVEIWFAHPKGPYNCIDEFETIDPTTHHTPPPVLLVSLCERTHYE